MKRFIYRVVFFLVLGTITYTLFTLFVVPRLLEAAFGINVKDQIDQSFTNALEREYELLILGNSKFYCGINPEAFSVKAFNFAHNNDTYNQMYYKLKKVLEKGKKIEYLVIGTDYFQFGFISDTRNYAYASWMDPAYLKDYKNVKPIGREIIDELKPHKMKRLLRYPYEKHQLKANGQFVRLGEASEDDFQKRSYKFNGLQVYYFDQIIELAKEYEIKVYIVMPPMRVVEREQYTSEQIEEFNHFIEIRTNTNVTYLDYSVNHNFQDHDFIDMAHLSQMSAYQFSEKINSQVFKK